MFCTGNMSLLMSRIVLQFLFFAVDGYRIACMKLEEYQTAKAALETGAPLAPQETRFASLIKECDEKIAGVLFDCYKFAPF